jgi:hypothetical protein
VRFTAFMLLMACAATAAGADTYDPGTNQLNIPVLSIGSAIYLNVVVTVGGIVSLPQGTAPNGTEDSFDPASKQLIVPAVTVGTQTYFNVVVTVAALKSIGSVIGADSYGGAQLSIGSVQAGNTVYPDVIITVGSIISVGGKMPNATQDEYDSANGRLSIAAVEVGGRVYTNVVVTVGQIVSAGADQPISVPAQQQWTFLPFSDARCADGTTTGIGVNLNSQSTRVLIYLEGGGACWSDLTCYTLQTAANFTTGYNASTFAAESNDTMYLAEPGGFFDRTDASNPYRNDNYIYIPYCTGDIHAGNNVVAYDAMHTAMHVGYANVTAYLKRIVPTFPSATRVTLAGSSAGGFGALINWDQTQRAFGATPVDMVDDSGTPMPPDIFPHTNPIFLAWAMNWRLAAALPAGCTNCANRLDALWGYYAATYPADKAALASYQQDSVLPSFYGIDIEQFEAGLAEEEALIAANANQRYFQVDAQGHVLFFTPQVAAGSTTLQTWLTEMTTNEDSWISIPAP